MVEKSSEKEINVLELNASDRRWGDLAFLPEARCL
jgi:hypothetical protein